MNKENRHKQFTPVPSELNALGKEIVDAAYKVHKNVGPGLLEKIYVLVEKSIICELKSVNEINPIWEAQVLSHLKLMNNRLGYLINFNVKNIGTGIQRFVL